MKRKQPDMQSTLGSYQKRDVEGPTTNKQANKFKEIIIILKTDHPPHGPSDTEHCYKEFIELKRSLCVHYQAKKKMKRGRGEEGVGVVCLTPAQSLL